MFLQLAPYKCFFVLYCTVTHEIIIYLFIYLFIYVVVVECR